MQLDADPDLSVGVLTGAGKGFCAGMDLKAFVAGESAVRRRSWLRRHHPRSADKPLIAAIEGFAVAGGLEVALACDLIVARAGREARNSGGQAVAGGGRRRAAAPPAGAAAQRRGRIGPDRRPDRGRARTRARDGQPADRTRRSARRSRLSWRRRSPPTDRWRWPPPSGSCGSRSTGPTSSSSSARRDPRRGVRLGGRARGRDRVRRATRACLEGPLGRGLPEHRRTTV